MDGIEAKLEGWLARDPELKFTDKALALLKFGVALIDARAEQRGQPVEWINVACFGELAERLDGRLRKGMAVQVTGRLRLSRWRTKDGEDRATLEVNAWNVTLLDRAQPRRRMGAA